MRGNAIKYAVLSLQFIATINTAAKVCAFNNRTSNAKCNYSRIQRARKVLMHDYKAMPYNADIRNVPQPVNRDGILTYLMH